MTIEDFSNSEIIKAIFPNVKEFANLFGSLPIRNRATVGGNIINASPIADITSLLLVLDAVLIFSNKGSVREVKLSDFYKGYKQFDNFPKKFSLQFISKFLPAIITSAMKKCRNVFTLI